MASCYNSFKLNVDLYTVTRCSNNMLIAIATATTVVLVSSSEASQPMSSNVIQPTTVETTTTISNTPTLARDSGRWLVRRSHVASWLLSYHCKQL